VLAYSTSTSSNGGGGGIFTLLYTRVYLEAYVYVLPKQAVYHTEWSQLVFAALTFRHVDIERCNM